MVLRTLIRFSKQELDPLGTYSRTFFLDRIRLTVASGAGGSGFPKINGAGGTGGSVFVQVQNKATFRDLLKKFPERKIKATAGGNSSKAQLLGKNGKDVIVPVPPGVTVRNETDDVLADLIEPGEKILVVKGGEGGSPRNNFTGKKGIQAQITLYLKLIADIGFVGFPNAGKSTLLRALSNATPKVANYPFTTVKPHVGIIDYPDYRKISCADLPGLIEGAHKNVGLGHNFLRHVERTSLLLFIVDVGGFQLGPSAPYRNAFEAVMCLNKELELYKPELITKPAILVVNKLDTEDAERKFEELKTSLDCEDAIVELDDEIRPKNRIQFRHTVGIVAKDRTNVENLKLSLRQHLDELHEEQFAAENRNEAIRLPELKKQLM